MRNVNFENPGLGDYDRVKTALREMIADKNTFLSCNLACEEIFVNIVSYSGAKTLSVTVDRGKEGLVVVFTDDGVFFDPTEETEKKDFLDLDTGGMGLNLVKDTVKDMKYSRDDGKNVLTLYFEA